MKFRTMLASVAGAGVGYVLGAAAGRSRFEQIKAQAQRIVSDPEVRQKVADLPNQVKENLPKAQSAVQDKLKGAQGKADDVKGSSGGDASFAAPVTTLDAPEATFDAPDIGFDTPAPTFETPATTFETTTFDSPATTFDTPGTTDDLKDDRL